MRRRRARTASTPSFYARISARQVRVTTHAAIIASTWLALRPENRSQGVDIDLEALQDTQAKLGGNKVQLLQSPAYAQAPHTVELPAAAAEPAAQPVAEIMPGYVSTWAEGQATARLDRRLAKRQQRTAQGTAAASAEPRLVLLHSDVLDLPVPPVEGRAPLEAPDIVASLNYAMAYFHDRATLLRYLRSVVASLRPKTGVFITDMFGGPPTGEMYEDQDRLWAQFWDEPGFRRAQDGAEQVVLQPSTGGDDLQVLPAPTLEQRGTRAEWPRGHLKLVRTGDAHGGFEYWREDGPIDYATNRFRMSLSFRFRDHSWLRDVFSYDFRIWSLREVCFSTNVSSPKLWRRPALPACAFSCFRAMTLTATTRHRRTVTWTTTTTTTTLQPCSSAPNARSAAAASSTQSSQARRCSLRAPFLPILWRVRHSQPTMLRFRPRRRTSCRRAYMCGHAPSTCRSPLVLEPRVRSVVYAA